MNDTPTRARALLVDDDYALDDHVWLHVDSAFAGSAAKLVMHALETKGASQDDIDQMRDLLDRLAEEES